MKILVLEPQNTPYVKEISDDISDMQKIVGGLIEPIYFEPKNDALVFCNEEFLLHDYAPNRFVGDVLVHGTFFVVGNTRNKYGEWVSCSLTDEQILKYTEQFWGYLIPIEKLIPEECDESENIEISQI